jgi:uncharacterized membrane protein YgaE (UPF0421/DUF939 family)
MPVPLPHRLRDPVLWTNASQLLKTVLAAVIAWILAVRVFEVPQAFLAPWAALLTVHATVYRTLRRGVQQVGASVLGVLLAFAAGTALGVNAVSLGVAIFLGLLAGSVRGLRAETTTAAATALVVLTTGYSDDAHALVMRLLDTGIGIAVGLLVNLLVWPPLRDRSAAHQVDAIDDRIGDLLSEIASALRGGCGRDAADRWIERTGELDGDIEQAWSVVRQARESGRLNLRRSARGRMRATEGFDGILDRLEQAVAETRSMARTIALAHVPPSRWPTAFRTPWLELLERAGAAVSDADVSAVEAVRADLDGFARELAVDALPSGFWPVAGALLVNVRNILDALDVVAEAQPVEVPAPALISRRSARHAGRPPTAVMGDERRRGAAVRERAVARDR